jgi:hypothetical protein
MNVEDKLVLEWTPYQLGWLSVLAPLVPMAVAVLLFVFLPLPYMIVAIVPMFATIGLSIWLTTLSVCPDCATPGADRYHLPTRHCRTCGRDLTVLVRYD